MTAFAELDLVARTEQLEAAVREIRKIGDTGERTEQRVSRSTNAINVGFGRMAGMVSGLVAGLASMQTAMASVTAARQFNAALAETSTLIDGNVAEMALITEGARAMSREFGGNATSQVQAYYQAISAGAGDAAAATRLLDAANRLAIGGVTDVTTGVDVLTTATNAYRAAGLTAADASDTLFVGMRAGKTTITELSASVGQVLPVATSLGVSFQETVAAMSALTTQGISTAQAATGVRAALTSMIAPTDQARELAAQLGIEFSAAGVQANGFGGIMQQVIDRTGGSTAHIQALFGSIEATTAALSFAGGAGDAFNQIMGQMAERAGATDDAFGLVSDSLNQRLNVVLAQSADLLLGLGNALLSVIVPAAETAIGVVNSLGENLAVAGVVMAGLAATQIPGLVIALAAKTAGMTAATIAAGVLTGAMRVLGVAIAFAGGPLGLVVGLIGAAAAAAYLFRDRLAELISPTDDLTRAQNALTSAMAVFSEDAAPSSARAAIAAANAYRQQAAGARDAAAAELARANAMMAAQEQQGLDPEAALLIGDQQARSVVRLRAAQEALADANRQADQAARLVTGSMSEGMMAAADATRTVTVEISNLNDALTLPSLDGGSGGSGGDGFGSRLDALTEQLQSERDAVEAWYQDAQTLLADQRALEIMGEEAHRAALLQVEELYQQQLAALRSQTNEQQLTEAADFFGAMASVTQHGGERLNKVTRALGATQAFINTLVAQSQVLADPTLGFFGKMAAYLTIGASGLGIVSALGGKSGGSGGGSGGSRAASTEPASRDRFVRIDVQGEGMFADMLRDSVGQIAEALFDDQRRGGNVILVGRS